MRTNLSLDLGRKDILSGPRIFKELFKGSHLALALKLDLEFNFSLGVKGCVLRSAESVSFNLQDITQSRTLLKNL